MKASVLASNIYILINLIPGICNVLVYLSRMHQSNINSHTPSSFLSPNGHLHNRLNFDIG